MQKECKYSLVKTYFDGLFAIKCAQPKDPKFYIEKKAVYEILHTGKSMPYNDECPFAHYNGGQIDCPFFEP